ncbi:MFS transporter [Candidatus Nitrososphaera sp. FF02]|uniref:MFS transporter n=1 Tax=Candidatus Nitrososphaera sp. FF02 TaxID=3398226 RepID=UPI0039EA40CF
MQSEGGSVEEVGKKIDGLKKIPFKPSVIIAISLASFFTYYDVSNYAYISPVLRNVWGVTDAQIAAGASLTIVGYVIGAVIITILSDSKGRKTAFMVSIVLLGAGSILSAVSQDMTQLMIFRLITGAGIGSELAIASVYIGEMSPRSKRGRYTSFLTILGWVGLTAAGPVSLSLVQGESAGIEGWRMVLGIAGIVALISLPFRLKMLESPRWLASKDRFQEANDVLQSIGAGPLESTAPSAKVSSLRFLKTKTSLLRMALLGAVWFLMYIPIYSALLLAVEYVNQGYTISESISVNLLGSLGFVAGGIAAIVLADRVERKYQIAIAGFLLSIGFVLRGIFIQDYAGLVFAGFVAFFANAWFVTAMLTYTSENFPTRVRSSATGIVEGSSRGIAAIAPFIFVALQPYGFATVMNGIAVFSFVGAGVMLALGIRTRGQPLEKLSQDSPT